MQILIICIFIACILPYLAKIPMAIMMQKQPDGYDNNHPRAQAANLIGFGARAFAAHNNSFEALIIFAIAVFTVIVTQHVTVVVQNLAIIYIISRVLYNIFYLMNWATLRSLIWGVGFIISLSMIWLCI